MSYLSSVTSLDHRRYAKNSVLSLHQHEHLSLTLVLSGSYEEEAAGIVSPQSRGSVLICPRDIPHAQRFGGQGACKIVITPQAAFLDYVVHALPVRSPLSMQSPVLARLVKQVDTERRVNDAFSAASIDGLLWQIVAEMGRELSHGGAPQSSIVRQACDMIRSSSYLPLSLTALCEQVGCHPATLNRAFRRDHMCTPGEYQRRYRVRLAADMLKATSVSMAEVAAHCGFCDQAHLARSFRSVIGCSPSQYRRRA